jgi:hypothetical protein
LAAFMRNWIMLINHGRWNNAFMEGTGIYCVIFDRVHLVRYWQILPTHEYNKLI